MEDCYECCCPILNEDEAVHYWRNSGNDHLTFHSSCIPAFCAGLLNELADRLEGDD